MLLLWLAPDAAAQVSTVSSIAEIRQLSPEEAAEGRPVRVRGVVTYHEPAWYLSFVQDASGGIYIANISAKLRAGELVEITGVTGPGGGAGRIITGLNNTAPSVRVLGTAPFPRP
ncbi:MAG TPA: hypothetical protein VF614_00745, partial [Chthoniobacteraceae bacterium]